MEGQQPQPPASGNSSDFVSFLRSFGSVDHDSNSMYRCANCTSKFSILPPPTFHPPPRPLRFCPDIDHDARMLEDPSYASIVRWGDEGDSFVVLEVMRPSGSVRSHQVKLTRGDPVREIYKDYPTQTFQAQQLCQFRSSTEQIRLPQSSPKQRRERPVAVWSKCKMLLLKNLFHLLRHTMAPITPSPPVYFMVKAYKFTFLGMGIQTPRISCQQQGIP